VDDELVVFIHHGTSDYLYLDTKSFLCRETVLSIRGINDLLGTRSNIS
jgi:hypothetical protein